MPKPKFSWETPAGSLVLKITDGSKETKWTFRKTTKFEDLMTALEEMVGTLSQRYTVGKPWPVEYNPYPDKEATWLEPVQATTEEDSKAALAAKAAKAQAGAWFSAKDDGDLADLPFMIPNQKEDE